LFCPECMWKSATGEKPGKQLLSLLKGTVSPD
jgi:hypothetical protein